MFDNWIDRVEDRLAPHTRAISWAAAAWFWIGVAINSHLLPLPDLPRAVDLALVWSGVAINAVWWGFLRPAIQRRRKVREGVEGEAQA